LGLQVYVYRQPGGMDCTNGGFSSFSDQLTLVNVDGPFKPTPDRPPALLVSHDKGIVRIVPAIFVNQEYIKMPVWLMFGGNYAASSDGRLTEAVEKLTGQRHYSAIAIHDRIEPATR